MSRKSWVDYDPEAAWQREVWGLEFELEKARSANDLLVRLSDERAKAQDELVNKLAQAMFQMYAEMGFDTDGMTGPDAMIAGMGYHGFTQRMIEAAKEFRRDYDEAIEALNDVDRSLKTVAEAK